MRSALVLLALGATVRGQALQACSAPPQNGTVYAVVSPGIYEVDAAESCRVRTVWESAQSSPAFYAIHACAHSSGQFVAYFNDGLHYVDVATGKDDFVRYAAQDGGRDDDTILWNMAWWPAGDDVVVAQHNSSGAWRVTTPRDGRLRASFQQPQGKVGHRMSAVDTDKQLWYIPFLGEAGDCDIVIVNLTSGAVRTVHTPQTIVHVFYDPRSSSLYALYYTGSPAKCQTSLPAPSPENPRAAELTIGRLTSEGLADAATLAAPMWLRWHAENDFNPTTGRYAYYAQHDRDGSRGDFDNGVGVVDIPAAPNGTLRGTATTWGSGLDAAAWAVCAL